MRRLADALCTVALTLWVGGLWTMGYLVAPTLFRSLSSDRPLAGRLAGQLFELIGWVGLGCAAYLLVFVVVGGLVSSASINRLYDVVLRPAKISTRLQRSTDGAPSIIR